MYTLVLVSRSQILQVNGYDHQKMTEEAAEETVHELIKMSHQEFQHDAKMIDHPKAEFRKYSYYQGRGVDHTKGTAQRDTFQGYANVSAQDIKALGDLDPANMGIRVKAESAEICKVLEFVGVLRSANGALQKFMHVAEELHVKLTQAGNLDTHAETLDSYIQEFATFIKDNRREVVMHESVAKADKTKDELSKIIEDLDKRKKASVAHQDGMKANLKKYKAML